MNMHEQFSLIRYAVFREYIRILSECRDFSIPDISEARFTILSKADQDGLLDRLERVCSVKFLPRGN